MEIFIANINIISGVRAIEITHNYRFQMHFFNLGKYDRKILSLRKYNKNDLTLKYNKPI